jgi:thiamine biosynthesis lipoprotein
MKATHREGRSMGSRLRLTLPGWREREIDAAWTIVEREFDATEADLTRFDATSALSRLNQAVGETARVPTRLSRALAAAWRAFRMTNGRFDPRIVGALEAFGERARVDLPPSPSRLDGKDRWLLLDPRRGTARLDAPIDLGGIGKGLALRWAATALRACGWSDYLLQAGGDIVARGLGPAARPWVVGIDDPLGGGRALAAVELRDAAIATSSIAVRRWSDERGQIAHHLIDPRSGRPARPVWWSVTVRSRDPAWAEVHSKVGFLAGAGIATDLEGVDAWWIGPDGDIHGSPSGPLAHASDRAPSRADRHGVIGTTAPSA